MTNRPSLDILLEDYEDDPRIQALCAYVRILETRMDRLAAKMIDRVETAAAEAVNDWIDEQEPDTDNP